MPKFESRYDIGERVGFWDNTGENSVRSYGKVLSVTMSKSKMFPDGTESRYTVYSETYTIKDDKGNFHRELSVGMMFPERVEEEHA